ncbi:MAG: NAD(P)-binding domain-containing protein [Actinomycetota bacterium]
MQLLTAEGVGDVVPLDVARRVIKQHLLSGLCCMGERLRVVGDQATQVAILGEASVGGRRYVGGRMYCPGPDRSEQTEFVYCRERGSPGIDLLVTGRGLGEWRNAALVGLFLDAIPVAPRSVAVIGFGRQAQAAARSALDVLESPFQLRVSARNHRTSEEVAHIVGCRRDRVTVHRSPSEAVRQSEVIIFATSSATPVIDADCVNANTVVIHIGEKKNGRSEIPAPLLSRASTVFVDCRTQALRESNGTAFTFVQPSSCQPLSKLLDRSRGHVGSSPLLVLNGVPGAEVAIASIAVSDEMSSRPRVLRGSNHEKGA